MRNSNLNFDNFNKYSTENKENDNFNNDSTEIEGTISGYKDEQTLEIEKTLNINKIPDKKPPLKTILENKDISFNKEYLDINNLYTSLNCYIKIYNKYDYGLLTVTNKNIIMESNKKLLKLRDWSFSEISTKNAKNNSSDIQLPNYIMNDTIDKIITGRNALKDKKIENPIYLLNINLDLVTCKLVVHKEKLKFRLLLLGYNKNNSNNYLKKIIVIKFNCLNVEKIIFYHVCEIINKCIILSEGYKSNLFGVNFRKNYFTKSYIDLISFIKEANTCDILLFKSYSSSGKCQRCLTKGDYDHIVLLIKKDNNLKLFDCIEEDGVRLRTFSEFMYFLYPLYYEKITYRKLNISIEDMVEYIHRNNIDKYENLDNYTLEDMSTNEIKNKFYSIINQKLEIFIHNNNNSKYDFPYCEYVCKSKNTKNKHKNKNTYFCSELVAAVYMFCQIMSNEYDPFDYLPGRFSGKEKIEFINGFHFGPEMIIEFSD